MFAGAGPRGDWQTAGTWAGDACDAHLTGNISPTTVAFFIYMDQATFVSFPMSIRAGIAPNNVLGPVLLQPLPVHRRRRRPVDRRADLQPLGGATSTTATSARAGWLDIQSCDKTVVTVGPFQGRKRQTSTWDETLADRGSRRVHGVHASQLRPAVRPRLDLHPARREHPEQQQRHAAAGVVHAAGRIAAVEPGDQLDRRRRLHL